MTILPILPILPILDLIDWLVFKIKILHWELNIGNFQWIWSDRFPTQFLKFGRNISTSQLLCTMCACFFKTSVYSFNWKYCLTLWYLSTDTRYLFCLNWLLFNKCVGCPKSGVLASCVYYLTTGSRLYRGQGWSIPYALGITSFTQNVCYLVSLKMSVYEL